MEQLGGTATIQFQFYNDGLDHPDDLINCIFLHQTLLPPEWK